MQGNADGRSVPLQGGAPKGDREWRRAAALFLFAVLVSAVPVTVLAGTAFVLLMLALPARRVSGLLFAALVAYAVTAGSAGAGGLWFAERGWAVLVGGWFAALSLRWPGSGFTPRGLGAVAGATATVGAFLAVRPGAWYVLDWVVGERMRSGASLALTAMALLRDGEPVPPALARAVEATAVVQHELFPGLLVVASLASLGVAWWMYVRVGLAGAGALQPLARFRFSDHLVWVLIAGVTLIVLDGSGLLARAGSNAVVVMGALYALRGAAVVLFVNGGISLLGTIALVLGLVFVAPVIVAGALLIGLGDTWLDLRARLARPA